MTAKTFGTWRRDGIDRLAYTIDDAVRFKFEGWEQVDDESEAKAKPEEADTAGRGDADSDDDDDDQAAEHTSSSTKAPARRRAQHSS